MTFLLSVPVLDCVKRACLNLLNLACSWLLGHRYPGRYSGCYSG